MGMNWTPTQWSLYHRLVHWSDYPTAEARQIVEMINQPRKPTPVKQRNGEA
jgi:hypothetical protein